MPCFTRQLLKWNLWLRWWRCFTSLLLKWNLWIHSLHCFTSVLIKWNLWLGSLPCFISILLTQETSLLSLRCPYPSSNFLSRTFSVSIKFVCATVILLSGRSVEYYMVYYRIFVSQKNHQICIIDVYRTKLSNYMSSFEFSFPAL